MICVTGATGTVGRELVQQLLAKGASFFIMARNEEAARKQFGDGVAIRTGDFSDVAGMTAIFKDVDRLFLLCAPGPFMADLESNAVAAAKAAGVRHVVKISAPGAATDAPAELLRMHGRVEAAIEQSGMAWTHLRPNGFMQNLWGPTQGIRKDASFRLSVGDATVPFVDATDIAAVAAAVLTEPGHEGKIYDITGSEAPTYHEVARVFAEALGRPVAYHPLSKDDCRALFLSEGLPEGLVGELVGYFELMAGGHAGKPTSAVRDVTGRDPVRLRDFVHKHLDTFRAIVTA